jgi:hypothetical protein
MKEEQTISISELIDLWYAEFSKRLSSQKGTTRVIPIKDMEESFIVLFDAIKENGYSGNDFWPAHLQKVLECCRPKYLKGKAQSGWDSNVIPDINKAKAAVFGSIFKPMSEIASKETAVRYQKEYKKLQGYKKNVDTSSENEDTISIEDEQQEEFEESDNFKPLNRSKLKESIPEVSEDDSWIHNMAESYDE